ncbi:17252_t:CDS:2 [Rhizophagus irregularis]|nr:17252_t:CDS:2 [Rhizophagus irregularis]
MEKKRNETLPNLATETIVQIFKDLDFHSLHSCALVNRYLCQVAIPMLWMEPFENIYKETIPLTGGRSLKNMYLTKSIKKLSLLVDTYINCLPEESKFKLTNAGIVGFYKTKYPNYDYPSFLQSLDIISLFLGCRAWLGIRFKYKLASSVETSLLLHQIRILFFELCKLFMSQSMDIKGLYLINKKFSEELECGEKCDDHCLKNCLINRVINPIVNQIPDLPGASKCLTKLECLGTDDNTPIEFLQKISYSCKEIKNLIFAPGFVNIDDKISILSSQNHLKYLILQGYLYDYSPETRQVFEKIFKYLEWLTIDGRYILPIKKLNSFENLVALEVVSKYQCYNQSYDIFKLLADVEFPKLQYLLVDIGISYFKLWSLIISKTTNLKKIVLHWNHRLVQDYVGFVDLTSRNNLPPNLRVLKHLNVPIYYSVESLELFFRSASNRLNAPLNIDLNLFPGHEHSKIAQDYFFTGLTNPAFTKFDYDKRLDYYRCNLRYI